ncbi:hypothetical protein MLD38_022984 [Melastoma candidum]|uniref:Uncharacterized protein n=1 Tax=Melastoma candidum TaxID=119954 RepID=A0ACB9QLM7_9MYRT|nr:hypothetical protein MLD38_022984 [Melastoma candidum]
MENVVETPNGLHSTAKFNGENGPSEESSDGVGITSTESQTSEGEDIFEEVLESQDHIPEEYLKLDTKVSIISGPDGNVAEAIANSGPIMSTEDFCVGKEAVGIPGEVWKKEEIAQEVYLVEKIEGSAGGERTGVDRVIGGIDDERTQEELSLEAENFQEAAGILGKVGKNVETAQEMDLDEMAAGSAGGKSVDGDEGGGGMNKEVTWEEISGDSVGRSLDVFEDAVKELETKDEVEEAIKSNDVDISMEVDLNVENDCLGTESEVEAGAEVEVIENKEAIKSFTDDDSADTPGENINLEMENAISRVDGDDILATVDDWVVKCEESTILPSHVEVKHPSDIPVEAKDDLIRSVLNAGTSSERQSANGTFAAVLKRGISLANDSVVTPDEPKTETDEKVLPLSQNLVDTESSQNNGKNHILDYNGERKDSEKPMDSNEVSKETGAQAAKKEPASLSAKPESNDNPPGRPAGLGRAAPLLEPAPRAAQPPRVNGAASHLPAQQVDDSNGETDEHDETREKLQMIRVKFLRLARRLGQTPHNVVVAQVLYRLGLAEQLRGRNGGRVGAFSFDRASALAEQLEASGLEPLEFSCTIMVLGKTGVGKSATINSIFDEVMFSTDAFDSGTKKVQDVVGTVEGIRVRVIDTPGLLPSLTDLRHNEMILHSIKRFIKKNPPDIVLYLDRLDMQSRDLSDMPLLRTITNVFGPSIWFNAIVVLTHAASAPPDGPNGTASSYDMFVTQRSHVVQQAIRQAAGDMRLMNPVSLVENHFACRTNRRGQRVLPNGQIWKPHLLLLSFASKILAEANALLKLQDSPPGKPFTTRERSPPLPFLLSTLLQPRQQVKLPEEQFDDEDGLEDLDEEYESEDESEYDELPPFKWLTKAQLSKLTRAQKKAYFDELEYREKLFMKKQLKEERRRRRVMKKVAAEAKDQPIEFTAENGEEENGGAASVPVSMPDLALPASFDSDNPTHRYRCLDNSNQWLIRPVLDTHGWDHDVGYEGVNLERLFVVKEKIPISFSGQVTKDKKDANVQMEVAGSVKHGTGKSTSLGFDMQTVGKDLAYTIRSETRFSNFKKNKMTAGLSATFLNDTVSAGFKFEDKLMLSKWLKLVTTGCAMTARRDVAYGVNLDATLRDGDYPLGRSLFTLGLSVMDWQGGLAIGGNVQCQLPMGRSTNLITRANLNNRGSGQVSIRVSSSEQIQIALLGLIPLIRRLLEYPQLQLGQ